MIRATTPTISSTGVTATTRFIGGGGNDYIVVSAAGNKVIDGGAGTIASVTARRPAAAKRI